ncbi:MAG: HD domain-containing protein [Butyricicoccaceae bacterium]
MIYTKWTKLAMKLAYTAHHGQMDKDGIPYIFHPIHLAEQMEDEYTTIAALLHDVIEDTEYTLHDLTMMGFPAEVLEALALLTHRESVPYLDYVRALRGNRIAAAVKRADLRHNSDLSRMDIVDETALARVEKYRKALEILEA